MNTELAGQFSIIEDTQNTDRDVYHFIRSRHTKAEVQDTLRKACVKFTTMRRGTCEVLTIDSHLDKPMGELLGKESFTAAVMEKMQRIHPDIVAELSPDQDGVIFVKFTRPELSKPE